MFNINRMIHIIFLWLEISRMIPVLYLCSSLLSTPSQRNENEDCQFEFSIW